MMAWTQDEVDKLKELHAAGNSFSQIARKIRGKTRNACIGKAHRLGLSDRVAFVFDPDAPDQRRRA